MRYIIGIDLGTTNSCVAYVDTQHSNPSIQSFRIPQFTAPGNIESLPTLPSFCYLAEAHEWPTGTLELPWQQKDTRIVGRFAQEQGARVPTRLIQSAKSWLCHSAANRRDRILPFEATDSFNRLSPVEASADYLRHIKEAWNFLMATGDSSAEFEEQEIILTVPASFDEVARTLTVEAAKIAGYVKMTLLEEPQAAFYSWISQHEGGWEQKLHVGEKIIVCDIGGGTTDFSLLEVIQKEGKLGFQRMAVGDHLLLGGDNMDSAVAHFLEEKIKAKTNSELSTTQWLQLRHQGRCAKEALLSSTGMDPYKIILHGTGSGIVSGSISTEISREDVQKLLVDGFFGIYPWEEAIKLQRARGLRSMGLPYEDDPCITKHLAAFINNSSTPGKPKAPDYLLFNGGVMKAASFQEATLQSLSTWFPEKKVKLLSSYNLDLAVARGAAYYGKVRRGLGVRIGGGAARGYYLAIEVKGSQGNKDIQALTLLPRGSEEGSTYEPEQTFWLTPNTPIAFQLYSSHVRLHDQSGQLVPLDPNELQALPHINTILHYGKQQLGKGQEKIPVHIGIMLSAIGTLELWLKSLKTDHKWSLEFQVRSASGQENSLAMLEDSKTDETFDATYLDRSKFALTEFFSGTKNVRSEKLMEHLEQLLDRPRREWPLSVLRGLCDAVLQQCSGRNRSPEYESRWWNLVGFLLRPGFGYTLDDFRMKELWKIVLADLKTSKSGEVQIQRWICFRRVSGGFNKGQQTQIANEIIPLILNKKSNRIEFSGKGELYSFSEKIRLLGALELIDSNIKSKVGAALVERIISGEASQAEYWALARIGARHLVYGSMVNVIPSAIAASWVEKLLQAKNADQNQLLFVLAQLARKTDQRELNLPAEVISRVLKAYPEDPRLNTLLLQQNALTQQEQEQLFGDRLPVGLSLNHEIPLS